MKIEPGVTLKGEQINCQNRYHTGLIGLYFHISSLLAASAVLQLLKGKNQPEHTRL